MDQNDLQKTKEMMEDFFKNPQMKILVVAAALLIFLLMLKPWAQIGAGERGVVLNFGAVKETVLNEGLHFRIPVKQEIIILDVKVQKAVSIAPAASKDLQDVSSEVVLNYHIIPDKANKLYQSLGIHFKERIIDPAIQEVVKAVTAEYTAEELITKRPAVSESMRTNLQQRLLNHDIAVDAFSIVSFSFSPVFTEAIEAKQTAEQHALKAARDLDRIKIEAEQKITAAKAEAESLRLQKANISRDLLELRKIEANLKAIEKWNGVLPNVNSGAMPFIDVSNFSK
jgi:regulator of protease activity HflC (stomatin/prohibitin superfamily)